MTVQTLRASLTRDRLRTWGRRLLPLGFGALTALAVFNWLFMPFAVDHRSERVVPDVIGLPFEDAVALLGDAELAGQEAAARVNPDFPPGVVLEQVPAPGLHTRPGRTIGLIVSQGRGEVDLPNLAGQSLRHAEMVLTREGVRLGDVSRRHADLPADQILAMSPPPGTRLVRGHEVDLLVSAGPIETAYLMPDFRGSDPERLETDLRSLGFIVEVVYPVGAFSLVNRVVAQSPPPGHRIAPGELVKLMVGDR